MRQNSRRLVVELTKTGTLIVPDALGLVGKSVVITMTATVVKESMIRESTHKQNNEAEIVCLAEAINIVEVTP